MPKPRLRHVAELAGVSEATVSRVVNERPGVADDTRREVLRALAQLGYEPTGLGRAQRSGLVGLIVPELDNPIFPAFAQAIEQRLARRGFTAILCTATPEGIREPHYIDVLLDRAVSGIVFVNGEHADTAASHARYAELADRDVPVVLVNGRVEGLDLPTVSVDEVHAARQSVRHLAALGHRRIGLAVGPRRYVSTTGKLTGYLEGMERTGLDTDPSLLAETVYSVEGGHAAGVMLLDAGATAVVCGSDLMALGVIRAAHERDLDVPGDLSVVGFDDAGLLAYVEPPLTSNRQPIRPMSTAVVRLLTERMAGQATATTELRFRAELVVRRSTGPLAPAPVRAQWPTTVPSARGSVAPAYPRPVSAIAWACPIRCS